MARILVVPAASLAVLALAAATASGVPCGPTTCAPLSSAVTGSRVLLVRPHGLNGPLVAYDLSSGQIRATLPDGVVSANGRRYVSVVASGDRVRLERRDPATGVRNAVFPLAARSAHVDAVSADGRYAAVTTSRRNPDVLVVDLDRGAVRKVHLDGEWVVDAISRDGRRLYLLEYAGSSYRVRLHDAVAGLLADPITDPREPEPMTGMPWSSVGTPDGRMQLTLYLKGTNRTEPFVHALSLTGPQAACIDLPGGDFMSSGRYALVLAPNGRTLYAANPSLGVVATIDLVKKAVVSTSRFPRAAVNASNSAAFGAVSPDGKTVYFSGGGGVLAYDVRSRAIRGRYAVGSVAGIGFHPSGRSVLVVKADGTTLRLDAATGATLRS